MIIKRKILWCKTPFPTFPRGGRRSKTFPPWGKMKGGKGLYDFKILWL
jgi:hypothetical protein